MQHVTCTRVKPEMVPWPCARSNQPSCVLASPLVTGHRNTYILCTGGDGCDRESVNDVWIGECNTCTERLKWKQVCACL